MKITWVLPELSVNGGTKIILDYARALYALGHEVICIYPKPAPPSLRLRVRRLLGRARPAPPPPKAGSHFWHVEFPVLQCSSTGKLTVSDFPDADLVIGTWWETVEWILPLPASKGRKCHFIQDYEIFEQHTLRRVEAVYRSETHKIVVSDWLSTVLAETYGVSSIVVPNGVDLTRFSPVSSPAPLQKRVGYLWAEAPRKNSHMALAALVSTKQSVPDLKATIFGADAQPVEMAGLDWVDYFQLPAQSEIPDLYRQCKFWLFASISEGFGLPILESLACGVPLIATRAGAAPTLLDGTNGILVDGEPWAMADAIIGGLALSNDRWRRMSIAARKSAERHGAAESARRFESALLALVEPRL